MTRETIEDLVMEATGRRDKVTLTRAAINLAAQELSKERLWQDALVEEEVSTVADQGYVDLASNLARVSEVRVIDGTQSYPLVVKDKSWIVEKCPSPESFASAKPTYGYLSGTRLYLVPSPDDVYTLRYSFYQLEPDLTGSSSELTIRYAGAAVAAWATHWVFMSLEKHEDAGVWLAKYKELLKSAKRADSDNPAIRREAEPRGAQQTMRPDFWNDPFVKRMP